MDIASGGFHSFERPSWRDVLSRHGHKVRFPYKQVTHIIRWPEAIIATRKRNQRAPSCSREEGCLTRMSSLRICDMPQLVMSKRGCRPFDMLNEAC